MTEIIEYRGKKWTPEIDFEDDEAPVHGYFERVAD